LTICSNTAAGKRDEPTAPLAQQGLLLGIFRFEEIPLDTLVMAIPRVPSGPQRPPVESRPPGRRTNMVARRIIAGLELAVEHMEYSLENEQAG